MYKKLLTIFLFLFLFLFFAKDSFASTLYLSPSSGKIGTGSVTYVRVVLNTGGESVNGVSAYLAYPADKLDVVSLSYGGAFNIAAEGSYGGGGIRISRGSISGASGNLTIATIGFRGKTEGTASVSFIGGSAAPRTADSSDSLSGTSGGTYTVAQGATSSAPPPKTGGGKAQATPTPKDTTKPEIINVRIDSVTNKDAIVTWNTNEKTASHIEYGLEKDKYFLNVADDKPKTVHSLKIESPLLVPGTKIHFRVVAKDEAGNTALGNDTQVQLPGFTIKVKVVDQQNKPLQNAEVLLYSESQKARTDTAGVASFRNVTPGKHLVVIKYKDRETTREVDVKDNLTVQNFTVNVQVSGANLPVFIVFLVLILLIAGAVIFIKKKRIRIFKQKQNNNQDNQLPQPQ